MSRKPSYRPACQFLLCRWWISSGVKVVKRLAEYTVNTQQAVQPSRTHNAASTDSEDYQALCYFSACLSRIFCLLLLTNLPSIAYKGSYVHMSSNIERKWYTLHDLAPPAHSALCYGKVGLPTSPENCQCSIERLVGAGLTSVLAARIVMVVAPEASCQGVWV